MHVTRVDKRAHRPHAAVSPFSRHSKPRGLPKNAKVILDPLLDDDEPPPFQIEREHGCAPFLLTADHAGCLLPRALGSLGLCAHELASHIAWDLGIAELGRRLAAQLDAFLILQTYSRLAIDVNRPLASPDSIADKSEYTCIPGNERLGEEERARRARAIFHPYHERIRRELERRAQRAEPVALVALHSFTPCFMGTKRPVHAGVLYGQDVRFGHMLLPLLRREPALVIGDNEPYDVSDATDYTILVHGRDRGVPHVELEIRQDLIADDAGSAAWAGRLATALKSCAPRLFSPTRMRDA